MKQFFIAGTDTMVGKTVTSAVLTLALKAHYWKPIQTGYLNDGLEENTVQQLTGLNESHFISSSYAFQAGLAIDQAAQLENVVVDLAQCILPALPQSLIVEGAGGVFHPINSKAMIFDLIKQINLPTILVSRGTIGTINHTLLTIESLRHRAIPIHGVVFSGQLNPKNQQAIEQWGKVRTLFHVPYFENLSPSVLQQWVVENQAIIMEGLTTY